ncbi:hypothetical protein ACYOEI_04720 [Singulisphaera rosea]
MEPSELLDYALGQLDGRGRERLERELVRDPRLAGIMARLVQNLARLLDDGRERGAATVPSSPPIPANSLETVKPPRAEVPNGGRPKELH